MADKVGPIPRISQVTQPRITGCPIPGTRFPISDPQDLPSQSSDFSLGLQIPGTGPPAGLRISRSLRRFPVPTGFLVSGSLDRSPLAPALPWVRRGGRPTPERPRMAGPYARPGVLERAGSCWQDPLAEALSKGRSIATPPSRGCARSRPLSVVYVLTREPQPGVERETGAEAEPLPLRCLREACAQLPGPRPRPQLRTLPFGKLALGDTAALDSFYNSDVVVLEVSSSLAQPSLFYHLGVRESFSMTNNVLLCSQADFPDLQALREDVFQKNTVSRTHPSLQCALSPPL